MNLRICIFCFLYLAHEKLADSDPLMSEIVYSITRSITAKFLRVRYRSIDTADEELAVSSFYPELRSGKVRLLFNL